MEHLQGLDDVCLSGGADGADVEWGRCAAWIGHDVIHWSFPGHKSQAPEDELVRLSDEQLELGTEAIEDAAKVLGKEVPSRLPVARLIRRNYYQVAWSSSCYGVTLIKDNMVVGGTGWAIMMFMQAHPGNHNIWVFDQDQNGWYQFNGQTWDRVESPPSPRGMWAGIGARELKSNGRKAIRQLMGCETE